MSTTEYGIVSSVQVMSIFLLMSFTLAIDRVIFRLLYDYKSGEERRLFLGTSSFSIFIFSIVGLLLVFVLKFFFVDGTLIGIDFYPYIFLMVLEVFFITFNLVPRAYLQIEGKSKLYVKLSILDFVVSSSFILYFIVLKDEGAYGMLKGRLLGVLLTLPFYLKLTYDIIIFKFDFKIFKNILNYSWPGIVIILSTWLLDQSDRIFLGKYFDMSQVGIYSLGYKIAGISLMIVGAINQAYTPYFYKLANSVNQNESKNKLTIINTLYIVIVIIVTFIISLFSEDFLILFIDSKYGRANDYIIPISVIYVFQLSSLVFNLSIYQNKKNVLMMMINFLGGGICVVLNLFLIPTFGSFGAIIATFVSYFIIFCIKFYFSKKNYWVPINLGELSLLFFVLFSIVTLFKFITLNIWLGLLLKVITSLSIVVIIYIKDGFFIKTTIEKYIRQKNKIN